MATPPEPYAKLRHAYRLHQRTNHTSNSYIPPLLKGHEMDIAETNLAHALGEIKSVANVCLVLPFTPSLLLDPTPLLPTIYQTVVAVPTSHIIVRLVTPSSTGEPAEGQLYDRLRRNPRANWDVLQRFLAEVYASLSAGQWACGKVLLDVEVAFAQASDQGISREHDAVLYLDGMYKVALEQCI